MADMTPGEKMLQALQPQGTTPAPSSGEEMLQQLEQPVTPEQTSQPVRVPLGNESPNASRGYSNVDLNPPPDQGIDEPPVEYPSLKLTYQLAGTALGAAYGATAGGGLVTGGATVATGAAGGAAIGTGIYNAYQNLIDVIRGTKDDHGQPISMSQQSLDMLRAGFQIAGAETGSTMGEKAMGLGAGQFAKAAGRIMGGGAGTAVGTLTADQTATAARIMGLLPKDARTPDMEQSVRDAVANGGLDMLFNTALHTPLSTKAAAQRVMQRVFGIGAEQLQAAETANKFGIDLSMNNLSSSGISDIYRKVTSIVPFLGSPFKKLAGRQEGQIGDYASSIAPSIAGPGGVPSDPELGRESVRQAQGTYDTLRSVFQDRYEAALAHARSEALNFSTNYTGGVDEAGNAVPSIKQAGQDFLKGIQARSMPQMKNGVMTKVKPGQGKDLTVDQEAVDFANRLNKLPDYVNIDELNNIGSQIDALYSRAKDSGTDMKQLEPLKNAVQSALESATYPQGSGFAGPAAMRGARVSSPWGQEFRNIQDEYHTAFSIFDQPGAKPFERVNRTIFRPGYDRPGSLSEDTVAGALYKFDSPDKVEQVANIVGPVTMRKAVSRFMDRTTRDSTTGIGPNAVFDPDKFSQLLSLDDPRSSRYAAVNKALQGTGYDMNTLKEFVDSVRWARRNAPGDTSSMLARKMTLGGGFKSVLKDVMPFLAPLEGAEGGVFGKGVGAISNIGLLLLGNKGSQILSNPMYVRDMNTFLDHSAGLAQRRMSFVRLVHGLYQDDLSLGIDAATENRPKVSNSKPPEFLHGASRFLLNQMQSP